jgi:hypothetical protein
MHTRSMTFELRRNISRHVTGSAAFVFGLAGSAANAAPPVADAKTAVPMRIVAAMRDFTIGLRLRGAARAKSGRREPPVLAKDVPNDALTQASSGAAREARARPGRSQVPGSAVGIGSTLCENRCAAARGREVAIRRGCGAWARPAPTRKKNNRAPCSAT